MCFHASVLAIPAAVVLPTTDTGHESVASSLLLHTRAMLLYDILMG